MGTGTRWTSAAIAALAAKFERLKSLSSPEFHPQTLRNFKKANQDKIVAIMAGSNAAGDGATDGSNSVEADASGVSSAAAAPAPSTNVWLPHAGATTQAVKSFMQDARQAWLDAPGNDAGPGAALPPLSRNIAGEVQRRLKQWVETHPSLRSTLTSPM